MTTIAVTGAYGKAGRAVVADLLEHGYEVAATDLAGPAGEDAGLGTGLVIADLSDYGQAIEVLAGADAVVHLGNIPAPGRGCWPDTINRNTAANSNVFLAAARLGLRKFETLLAIDQARDLLGYAPAHSWRDHVDG